MVYFILLLTLVTTALCQMNGMQPDVRFGEENDRFDVDNIVQMQNRLYQQQMDEVEEDDDLNTERRQNDKKHHRHHHKHRNLPNAALIKHRRSDFLLHKNLNHLKIVEEGDSDGYLLNLKPFNRRVINRGDKSQQLLNYAVPIDVKIKGYLRAPLEKD